MQMRKLGKGGLEVSAIVLLVDLHAGATKNMEVKHVVRMVT